MSQFEVEAKFHVADLADLEDRLRAVGGVQQHSQLHRDTYYNHPCRDFAETSEALRVRRVDGVASITYKGRKLPGAIKARRELEWPLDPGDADGTKMEQLLELLGFQAVGIVQKRRRVFAGHGELRDFAITIDDVQSLGLFAEIELVVADSSEIEAARQRIKQLGERLGLHQAEPRSYLRLLLGQKSPADQGG